MLTYRDTTSFGVISQTRFGKTYRDVAFPGSSEGKASACSEGDLGSIPGSGRFPWRRKWQPTPVLLPGKIPWTEKPGRL